MDSRGRLFVGDRSNNRIKILDQGKLLAEWLAFSRPSGIYIDKQDNIYVADSESESVSRNHNGWKRGIRIGRTSDGVVTAFIPDPVETAPSAQARPRESLWMLLATCMEPKLDHAPSSDML